MRLRPEEITSILKERIEQYDVETDLAEVGGVLQVGDGIARIHGLENAVALELLELEHGVSGIALNLEEDNVGAALFGDWELVKEGQPVRRAGQVASVPVGDALVGHRRSSRQPARRRPADRDDRAQAARVQGARRRRPQPVHEPLQTGLKAIDSMVPIGRGQRELIIGDRSTGKTAIRDTILNQRGQDMICIYVAIGQKASTVAQVYERLRDEGAMDYTIIVSASAAEAAPIKWMAPFAGARWASTSSTAATRSACTTTCPSTQTRTARCRCSSAAASREAYPGDVFLHSRLERAVKLSDELGGGSLTALPVIETQAGDISAYIPTNVISHHRRADLPRDRPLLLGVRPAINVGVSVSRVGGNAQTKAMKKVAGRLRLDLAQYRELEAFAQFGSELDPQTQRTLARGERMVAPRPSQYKPWPMEEQVAAIWVAVNGYLDECRRTRCRGSRRSSANTCGPRRDLQDDPGER